MDSMALKRAEQELLFLFNRRLLEGGHISREVYEYTREQIRARVPDGLPPVSGQDRERQGRKA